jgi:hypothetical protein
MVISLCSQSLAHCGLMDHLTMDNGQWTIDYGLWTIDH